MASQTAPGDNRAKRGGMSNRRNRVRQVHAPSARGVTQKPRWRQYGPQNGPRKTGNHQSRGGGSPPSAPWRSARRSPPGDNTARKTGQEARAGWEAGCGGSPLARPTTGSSRRRRKIRQRAFGSKPRGAPDLIRQVVCAPGSDHRSIACVTAPGDTSAQLSATTGFCSTSWLRLCGIVGGVDRQKPVVA